MDEAAVKGLCEFLEISMLKQRIDGLEKERDYFQQQYVRKCEHELEVRQQNQKLEEALQEINKRLNDSDSWLAQSIDCRNIAEAALGEKKDEHRN
jgi:hypothetical protein